MYVKICCIIYGLSQAGELSTKLLKKHFTPFGYYKLVHTPSLQKAILRLITLNLIVDNFSVKYVGYKHTEHLFGGIKTHYSYSKD